MVDAAHAREAEELGWFFMGVGPTLGLRSAGLERGAGGLYDDHASHLAHMGRRSVSHRVQVGRLRTVTSTLDRVSASARATLAAAFTSFGSGRASVQLQAAFAVGGRRLLAVAVATDAARRLWREAQGRSSASFCELLPTPPAILAVLEDALPMRGRITAGSDLAPVLDESVRRVDAALSEYARERKAVHAFIEAERRALRERELDQLIEQMGGAA